LKIRISARHSDLARLQAYRVGEALQRAVAPEKIEVVYNFRASLGDLNLNDPLWKMPEKGVFTEDFIRDLTTDIADLVVHSWKDLPTQPRIETEVVATLPRADLRDVLLFRRDRMSTLERGGEVKILTSSPRRSHNLRTFLLEHLPRRNEPGLTSTGPVNIVFKPVRGNIPTRLKKLLQQDVDGLVVAKAALDRLIESPETEFAATQAVIQDVLAKVHFMVLPISVNPTAAAQGALAIEILKTRTDLRLLLAKINCTETFQTVQREREILASYGGGCHQKIGVNVIRRPYGEITYLRGHTDAGEDLNQVSLSAGSNSEQVVNRGKTPLASAERVFPRPGEESSFFQRVDLTPVEMRQTLEHVTKAGGLWVARETAWTAAIRDMAQASSPIVWTAGLTSWRKLAHRGVWVHGSAEGLGEAEPMRLEALTGNKNLHWVKLTHILSAQAWAEKSARNGPLMSAVGTYRLVPKEALPVLTGRTHFFWMSGTSFDVAIKHDPSIRSASHASGPGLTAQHLRTVLGASAQISVYLNVNSWREAMIGTDSVTA
jgi:hydroxymethylbilane synthase